VGAPRNDSRVASHANASSRLLLPSPLAPSMTVRPSGGSSMSAEVQFRKSDSQR
jgi:hypothetical protein